MIRLPLYYLANQIYQFTYTLSIREQIGGKYIAPNHKKYNRFYRQLEKGLIEDPPPVVQYDIKNLEQFNGIIVSQSNTRIICHSGDCITIFVGHGTGDKVYREQGILNSYDYLFISGPKHLAKLADEGITFPEEKAIAIGNPRFDAYLNGKYDRQSIQRQKNIQDTTRKTVLYAPTFGRGYSTLLSNVFQFSRLLSTDFNLIIRPHHFDAKYIPLLKSWVFLQGLKRIYFSNPAHIWTNDTMTDFAASDLLISDTSSVLYEYLVTGNPIIIASTNAKDLHAMPSSLDIRGIPDVYYKGSGPSIHELVHKNLSNHRHAERYRELLENCFYLNDGKSTQRAIDFISSL
ncbi:MAG: CDP-glycerol glycerophosphotransferase family protein [Candidatus Neomarinimicrobiota bacterium]